MPYSNKPWKNAKKVKDLDGKFVPEYALKILNREKKEYQASLKDKGEVCLNLDVMPFTYNVAALTWYKNKKLNDADLWEQMHAKEGEETKFSRLVKNTLEQIARHSKKRTSDCKGGVIFRRRNLHLISA